MHPIKSFRHASPGSAHLITYSHSKRSNKLKVIWEVRIVYNLSGHPNTFVFLSDCDDVFVCLFAGNEPFRSIFIKVRINWVFASCFTENAEVNAVQVPVMLKRVWFENIVINWCWIFKINTMFCLPNEICTGQNFFNALDYVYYIYIYVMYFLNSRNYMKCYEMASYITDSINL